jgi:hypothetical protein
LHDRDLKICDTGVMRYQEGDERKMKNFTDLDCPLHPEYSSTCFASPIMTHPFRRRGALLVESWSDLTDGYVATESMDGRQTCPQ